MCRIPPTALVSPQPRSNDAGGGSQRVIPNPTTEASFAPTIVDLLRQRAAYRPHDRAFTFLVDGEHDELNVTYAELDRKARAVGAWLIDRG